MGYDAAMFKQRQTIANKYPIVSGKHQTEEEVYNPKSGPGGDIYVKGSWVLHTLRGLIGDQAFWTAVRREVYGRPDPTPGNFQPRFGSTNEFEAIAGQEGHRNLKWFFDVYLRQAHLPRLVTTRQGTSLNLQWQTPKGLPFPMPVEVDVDGQRQVVPMTSGRGTVTLPNSNSVVTVDPESKILRQNDAMAIMRPGPRSPVLPG